MTESQEPEPLAAEQEPRDVTKAAVLLDAKGTAEKLNKTLSYIYAIGDKAEIDRYGRFLQLYHAVSDEGAELFYQDFTARHKRRMLQSKLVTDVKIEEAIGDFLNASAKFLSAIFRRSGSRIVKEGNKLLQVLATLMSFGRKLQDGEEEELEESRRDAATR